MLAHCTLSRVMNAMFVWLLRRIKSISILFYCRDQLVLNKYIEKSIYRKNSFFCESKKRVFVIEKTVLTVDG